ncbi:hypothetical protein [uncultured Oscillibacter sp.]|uniref:hypothetical protein n=1 Tax=uncultured Oscillibacter sp. TaxID=876091 RepID=UPI0026112224|nr:hypothetical protein [uncultured Oscillibacter sp.]
MTREELFRAVGEVREDQIEAAEIVKKQIHPWRRFGALAACLALVVTVAAAPELREADHWKWTAIVKSFNPGAEAGEDPDVWKAAVRPFNPGEADSGGETAAGGLDGSDYWTDSPNRPTHPDYSTGVEIGQLSGPGSGDEMIGMSSCLAWLSPEEIFAQDTVIFRGTVRELHYFMVEPDAGDMEHYYTRALVEVTDSIRGGLTVGETYSLLWLGARGYMSTSISGALEDLDVGGEAIFMPARTDQDTGWKQGSSYFCYADLADFYLGEGTRYVFADTAEGLVFDRSTYEEIAGAETLDEIAAYIREQIGEEEPQRWVVIGEEEEPESGGYVFVEGTEQTQPAAVPAAPQTEPSETVNAGPSASGPSGALELPGGAYVSE